MSETIESLEAKIKAIRESANYKGLLTKHRGPADENRLRELNQRIQAFEFRLTQLTQARDLNARVNGACLGSSRILGPPRGKPVEQKIKGVTAVSGNRLPIKAAPIPTPATQEQLLPMTALATPFNLPKKSTTTITPQLKAPPRPDVLGVKPKISAAQLRGMPPQNNVAQPLAPRQAVNKSSIVQKGRPAVLKPGVVKAKPRGEAPIVTSSSILKAPAQQQAQEQNQTQEPENFALGDEDFIDDDDDEFLNKTLGNSQKIDYDNIDNYNDFDDEEDESFFA